MSTYQPSKARMFEIAEKLADFVCRVAADEKASPAELEILPEIVKILYGMGD